MAPGKVGAHHVHDTYKAERTLKLKQLAGGTSLGVCHTKRLTQVGAASPRVPGGAKAS